MTTQKRLDYNAIIEGIEGMVLTSDELDLHILEQIDRTVQGMELCDDDEIIAAHADLEGELSEIRGAILASGRVVINDLTAKQVNLMLHDLVEQSGITGRIANSARRISHEIERHAWDARAFAEHCAANGIHLDGDQLTTTVTPVDIPRTVLRAMQRYIRAMMGDQQLFSTAQAASYVGLSEPGIRYYIHVQKIVRGELIGGSYVFHRADLDDLIAHIERKEKAPV